MPPDWLIWLLVSLGVFLLVMILASFIVNGIDRKIDPRLNEKMIRAKNDALMETEEKAYTEKFVDGWLDQHWEPLNEWVPTPDQKWEDNADELRRGQRGPSRDVR
ncbi:hypothetical protein SEA_GENAMY16_78 [Gordonia phage Genamy16]|uniref:Uncharacterized protein n=2 Tax=Lambovirus TaxID=2843412 RepID=A0A9E7Q6X9_9CAUD|nr:hypothetical protein SEA_GENAMY16_78 [Gordonia phage Genamy16]UVF61780.1 hypothetical protein SEA_NOVASHARKS_77 [Gordonia phage NovaSharks]UVK63158.1 membrane protein [Gordonia phage Rumi]WNM65380.1 hypothetical protein SEA_ALYSSAMIRACLE_78 [Gordonia phage Alyssamiracle]